MQVTPEDFLGKIPDVAKNRTYVALTPLTFALKYVIIFL